jgi:hypothetical protein
VLGSKVGALIGLGIEGEEGFEKGQKPPPKTWTSLPTRRPGTSWPTCTTGRCPCVTPSPSRGVRLSDGFISSLDLVEIGLMDAQEAKVLPAMETTAAAIATTR